MGCCRTRDDDSGRHVVCARMTVAFLNDSLERGNDLITPRPEWRFPGLKPGDRWCVCAERWLQAQRAGVAPPVSLEATHESALEVIPLALLHAHRHPADAHRGLGRGLMTLLGLNTAPGSGALALVLV